MSYDTADPFEGIDTVQRIPAAPTAAFKKEVESTPIKRSTNPALFRGFKKQTIRDFVSYLKQELPGHANPDMTVTIDPFTTNDLELLAGEFLDASATMKGN